MDDNTRIIDLTVGELRGLFAELSRPAQPTEDRKVVTDFTDTKYVVGIAGVAKALGIGKTKAQQLVNDEKFAPAIIHPYKNAKIYADAEMLREIYFGN